MKPRHQTATGTGVSVPFTIKEIQHMLEKVGATDVTISDRKRGGGLVEFVLGGSRIRFPVREPEAHREDPKGWERWTMAQKQDWVTQRHWQYDRESWRRVYVIIRAKLDLIQDCGRTVEQEFFTDALMAEWDRTFWDWFRSEENQVLVPRALATCDAVSADCVDDNAGRSE